jgi:glycolate oxidase FAD binding subunit
MLLAPPTSAEFAAAVRATPRVLAVGAGTKPRLAQSDATPLSTRALRGIVEYEPSEFTFTALAGTPVAEIAAVLAEKGQYLPFDPFLVESDATLGGTVASGLSGPGRFRYGGLRDFILGVQFVDGAGRLLRMGGKVVKNAAGFDLPKFFVGSLGRYGVLTEITFKVFPRAATFRTVRVPTDDLAATMMSMASTRWELDALDAYDGTVFARIGGPEAALAPLTAEIAARFPGSTVLGAEEAEALWTSVREFTWAHADGVLVKVALTPRQLPSLLAAVGEARVHVSAGGNVAYVSQPAFVPCFAGFPALTLRGDAPLFPGELPVQIAGVKAALDPDQRFPD